jgi:hypothetical protein
MYGRAAQMRARASPFVEFYRVFINPMTTVGLSLIHIITAACE